MKVSQSNLPLAAQQAPKISQKSEQRAQLEKVAEGLETIFLKDLLAEMRKTVPEVSEINNSQAEKVYRNMLDDEYSKLWSRTGGIGLADLIVKQLSKRIEPPKSAEPYSASQVPENRQFDGEGDSTPSINPQWQKPGELGKI